jgi:AcrR family transcriptional regulator
MNSNVKDDAWAGEPLPRGRHKLPKEAVKASQRERLLRAMEELVGERGYQATTVPQIIAAAHVSSNTFYSFFSDKTDCFIALCEAQGEELLAQLIPTPGAAQQLDDAQAALTQGVRRYLRWWIDRPAMARSYFVELPAAGPRAIAERERQYARFADMLRFIALRARELRRETAPLREVDVVAASLVSRELVAREIREGKLDKLADLEDDLLYLLIRLLVDDEAARMAVPDKRRKKKSS